jgi:UDP-N-acetylmuramoyl-tripeptide--D-alanyl-D-alanine ligase
MGELGETSAQLHAEAGVKARACGIDSVHAVGELSRLAVEGFGGAGHHYTGHAELIDALRARLSQRAAGDVTVLVKGSRRMRMEQVVEALLAERQQGKRGG